VLSIKVPPPREVRSPEGLLRHELTGGIADLRKSIRADIDEPTVVRQRIAWAEEIRPQDVPVETAKSETGLGWVPDVGIQELRSRDGRGIWVRIEGVGSQIERRCSPGPDWVRSDSPRSNALPGTWGPLRSGCRIGKSPTIGRERCTAALAVAPPPSLPLPYACSVHSTREAVVGGFNRGNFFSALAGLIVGAMLIAALPGSAQAGDPMLIGRRNHSLPTTSLVAAGGLRVKVGQGTNPALQLEVQAGVAPIQVDSTALVANLNADLHDGMEASDFATSGHAHNSTGGDLSHDNMHPYETIQCIIALSGVYPSRNDGPLTTGSGRVLDPWVGEIAWFAGGFAPRGWAFCDGQLLPIAQYQSLFSILGTTYGGDGRTTFGLPDMRGRSPISAGSGPGLTSRSLGYGGGSETTTLTVGQLAAHTHP